MAKRTLRKDDKQPDKKDNSQVKIAIITGIVAIFSVLITAIGGPVILKILDRTPVPPSAGVQPPDLQNPIPTKSAPPDATQKPSPDSTVQYPILLSIDAEVKLNSPLGEVIYKILETQLDIYNTDNLSLKFLIRLTNNAEVDHPFGWSQSRLRLLVDDVPYEPINNIGVVTIVPAQSSKEAEFVFVFPVTAKNLVLRISHWEDATEIPINLNATKP